MTTVRMFQSYLGHLGTILRSVASEAGVEAPEEESSKCWDSRRHQSSYSQRTRQGGEVERVDSFKDSIKASLPTPAWSKGERARGKLKGHLECWTRKKGFAGWLLERKEDWSTSGRLNVQCGNGLFLPWHPGTICPLQRMSTPNCVLRKTVWLNKLTEGVITHSIPHYLDACYLQWILIIEISGKIGKMT